jgi:MraZ protein
MTNLIGEFECRIDAKGRIMMPSSLKKQLSGDNQEKFVINRGFEKCLVLYPLNDWKKISDDVNKLNLYNKKNREFVRYFYRGATDLLLDSSSRFLIPKSLTEYAGIEREVVLFAFSNRIEIWAKDAYETLLTDEPEDFASLAEEVMGKQNTEQNGLS